MLKKIGFMTLAMAAGSLLFGGMASADTHGGYDHHAGGDQYGQVGVANLNNIDALHNVNAAVGVCGNDINVLGVQVPIRDALDGLDVPILSPGENKAAGQSPYNCASGSAVDGGSVQHN